MGAIASPGLLDFESILRGIRERLTIKAGTQPLATEKVVPVSRERLYLLRGGVKECPLFEFRSGLGQLHICIADGGPLPDDGVVGALLSSLQDTGIVSLLIDIEPEGLGSPGSLDELVHDPHQLPRGLGVLNRIQHGTEPFLLTLGIVGIAAVDAFLIHHVEGPIEVIGQLDVVGGCIPPNLNLAMGGILDGDELVLPTHLCLTQQSHRRGSMGSKANQAQFLHRNEGLGSIRSEDGVMMLPAATLHSEHSGLHASVYADTGHPSLHVTMTILLGGEGTYSLDNYDPKGPLILTDANGLDDSLFGFVCSALGDNHILLMDAIDLFGAAALEQVERAGQSPLHHAPLLVHLIELVLQDVDGQEPFLNPGLPNSALGVELEDTVVAPGDGPSEQVLLLPGLLEVIHLEEDFLDLDGRRYGDFDVMSPE